MDDSDPTGRLLLADWRRRVAELYAEVRVLAVADPEAAWDRWRRTRETLYREHPASPVPEEKRRSFAARQFAYDPRLRFELALTRPEPAAPEPAPETAAAPRHGLGLPLPISVGPALSFERIGYVEVPFATGVARLGLFWLPEYAGGLFLPFRDATNGRETYGGGRYLLDTAKGADLGGDPARGSIIVDFNFAYQPSCAFDPQWSCPLSPPENRLDIRIEAGEIVDSSGAKTSND